LGLILENGCYQVEKGQTILVHAAAGGMGSLLVQWANSLGATVIGGVSTEEKAKKAKEDGAHHVILYSDKNLVERVKEITNGAGVSVVYDSVGKDTFQVKPFDWKRICFTHFFQFGFLQPLRRLNFLLMPSRLSFSYSVQIHLSLYKK